MSHIGTILTITKKESNRGVIHSSPFLFMPLYLRNSDHTVRIESELLQIKTNPQSVC